VIGAKAGKLHALVPLFVLLAGFAIAGIGLTASLWATCGLSALLMLGTALTFTEL
jgi:hypothetical protein